MRCKVCDHFNIAHMYFGEGKCLELGQCNVKGCKCTHYFKDNLEYLEYLFTQKENADAKQMSRLQNECLQQSQI